MKITSAAAVLVTLLTCGVESQGGCYGSGLGFPNKDTAYYHARRACRGYDGVKGAFEKVYFVPNSQSSLPATACVNAGDNWHIVMQWTNLRNYGQTLAPDFCATSFENLIKDCWAGGEFVSGYDWKFRLDPNSGYC